MSEEAMSEKEMKEREDIIQALVDKYGHIKVNLCEEENRDGRNGEGVWAVVINEEGSKLAKDNSSDGDVFDVYICNQPFSWPVRWGSLVKATTRGNGRPCAYVVDQPGWIEMNKEREGKI